MPEVPYLADAAAEARSEWHRHLPAIAEQIRQEGYWQEIREWRISTETTFRIEPEERWNRRWFRVSVSCDSELTCHAPALERAIEYMGVFDKLTRDLFWTLGWASWADRRRPEPDHNETTP